MTLTTQVEAEFKLQTSKIRKGCLSNILPKCPIHFLLMGQSLFLKEITFMTKVIGYSCHMLCQISFH